MYYRVEGMDYCVILCEPNMFVMLLNKMIEYVVTWHVIMDQSADPARSWVAASCDQHRESKIIVYNHGSSFNPNPNVYMTRYPRVRDTYIYPRGHFILFTCAWHVIQMCVARDPRVRDTKMIHAEMALDPRVRGT